jgi:hypothetical protein
MTTTAEKLQIIGVMLEELAAENPGQPVPIKSGEKMIGLFYPTYVSTRTTPPKLSPEHWAELKRRHENRDDDVSGEEMIEMVMSELRRLDSKP